MTPKWRQLDALNFFLADVRGGFGPYLGIFLLTTHNWSPATIGLVATIAGLAGLVFNAPAGALIDAIRWKRGIIVLGVAVLAWRSSRPWPCWRAARSAGCDASPWVARG